MNTQHFIRLRSYRLYGDDTCLLEEAGSVVNVILQLSIVHGPLVGKNADDVADSGIGLQPASLHVSLDR
jgi:hypothetical protein